MTSGSSEEKEPNDFIYVLCQREVIGNKRKRKKFHYRKYVKHGNSGCYRCHGHEFSRDIEGSLSKFILRASVEGHDVYMIDDEKLRRRIEIDDWNGWVEYLQLDEQLKRCE